MLGTPVRDHERTRVNEERGEAGKENGTEGEECMKLELERKEKTRARRISRCRRRGRSRRAGLKKGVGEAWKLERSGKVLLIC